MEDTMHCSKTHNRNLKLRKDYLKMDKNQQFFVKGQILQVLL